MVATGFPVVVNPYLLAMVMILLGKYRLRREGCDGNRHKKGEFFHVVSPQKRRPPAGNLPAA